MSSAKSVPGTISAASGPQILILVLARAVRCQLALSWSVWSVAKFADGHPTAARTVSPWCL